MNVGEVWVLQWRKKFQKTLILAILLHYYCIFIVLCDGGNLSQKCVMAWNLKSTHLSWKKRKDRLIFTDNLRKIVVVLQSQVTRWKWANTSTHLWKGQWPALWIVSQFCKGLTEFCLPKTFKNHVHPFFLFLIFLLTKVSFKQDFDWQVFDRWHFASFFFLTDYWNFLDSNQFQKVEKFKK